MGKITMIMIIKWVTLPDSLAPFRRNFIQWKLFSPFNKSQCVKPQSQNVTTEFSDRKCLLSLQDKQTKKLHLQISSSWKRSQFPSLFVFSQGFKQSKPRQSTGLLTQEATLRGKIKSKIRSKCTYCSCRKCLIFVRIEWSFRNEMVPSGFSPILPLIGMALQHHFNVCVVNVFYEFAGLLFCGQTASSLHVLRGNKGEKLYSRIESEQKLTSIALWRERETRKKGVGGGITELFLRLVLGWNKSCLHL